MARQDRRDGCDTKTIMGWQIDARFMKISPAIFGAAIIMFLLPFINVSCQGQKVASFSGIQLVTGTTIEEPTMFGGKQSRKIQAEILAILAFLAAIAGLALSFLKIRQNTIAMAIIGGIGAVMLLFLKLKLDKDILRGGQGMLQLEYAFGFWLALLLNLSAAGLNTFIFYKDKKDSETRINQLSSN